MSTPTITPEQVAAIINDAALSDIDKVAKLRDQLTPTIDPSECAPDRLYLVEVNHSGITRTGWRGGSKGHRWAAQNSNGGMSWHVDGEITVHGEVPLPADPHIGKSYDTFSALVADGAGVGTVFTDNDGDYGVITDVIGTATATVSGRAAISQNFAPFTITGWVAE